VWFVRDRPLDRDAAVLGLLLALALAPLNLLTSQIYVRTLPLTLGAACLVYLYTRRHSPSTSSPSLPRTAGRLLPAVVFALLGVMAVLAAVQGARTVAFYDLANLAAVLVAGQTILVDDEDLHPGVVLTQVVALAFVVRFAALYTNPGYIGIDVWSHMTHVRNVVDAHSLAAMSDVKYYAAPLFHLYVGQTALVADTTFRHALWLSVGLVMTLSVLLVYPAARTLLSVRYALLATTLFSVSNQVIRWGIHLIPTSLGLVFFLAVLWFLLRILRSGYLARDFALTLFFSVAVVFTHQISSFVTLVLVIAVILAHWVVTPLVNADPRIGRSPFGGSVGVDLGAIFVVDLGLMTFMWSLTPYRGTTFLQTLFSLLVQTLLHKSGFLNLLGGTKAATTGTGAVHLGFVKTLTTYLNNAGFDLLLFAMLLGALYALYRTRRSVSEVALVIAACTMIFFILGLPVFGIRTFIPGRWYAFAYAPMVLLGTVGLAAVARRVGPRTGVTLLLVFVVAFSGVMLISNSATIDNPMFPSANQRLSYSEAELAAVHAIGEYTPQNPGFTVYTDHPYQTVVERTGAAPAAPAPITNGTIDQRPVYLYRTYQTHDATYFASTAGGAVLADPPRSSVCGPQRDVVYANDQTALCVTPGGPRPSA